MSVETDIRTLRSEIGQAIPVIERLEAFLCDYESAKILGKSPGTEEAMVVTQALTNYYTCLETIYLRISRFFENSLSPHNWHRDLLEKMTLEIDQIRPRVISDKTHHDLQEILQFRHFTRNYFELDYDWDKLGFLLAKFHDVRPRIKAEFQEFDTFLAGLVDG